MAVSKSLKPGYILCKNNERSKVKVNTLSLWICHLLIKLGKAVCILSLSLWTGLSELLTVI